MIITTLLPFNFDRSTFESKIKNNQLHKGKNEKTGWLRDGEPLEERLTK